MLLINKLDIYGAKVPTAKRHLEIKKSINQIKLLYTK